MSRESRDDRETDETHWECSMIHVELSGLAGRPVGDRHYRRRQSQSHLCCSDSLTCAPCVYMKCRALLR
jgi:hypothetical protein